MGLLNILYLYQKTILQKPPQSISW
jgi:hypothetical protein